MSVLIKGMKKPKTCYSIIDGEAKFCPFVNTDDDCVLLLGKKCYGTWEEQYADCPLVELPEKHGRLIDGDALWDVMSNHNDNEGAKMPFGYDDTSIHIDSACFVIENAPTVIEEE